MFFLFIRETELTGSSQHYVTIYNNIIKAKNKLRNIWIGKNGNGYIATHKPLNGFLLHVSIIKKNKYYF